MARTFRRPRSSHPISELNVTNLVDLGFTLLIVFMLAAPLASEQTVPVNLPIESAKEQTQVDKNTKHISLTMDAQRVVYLDNSRIDLDDIVSRLRTFDPKNTVIRIRADAKVSYQDFISMVDEVKKSGLSRLQFDTQASR